jgi:hypothetical protein
MRTPRPDNLQFKKSDFNKFGAPSQRSARKMTATESFCVTLPSDASEKV